MIRRVSRRHCALYKLNLLTKSYQRPINSNTLNIYKFCGSYRSACGGENECFQLGRDATATANV